MISLLATTLGSITTSLLAVTPISIVIQRATVHIWNPIMDHLVGIGGVVPTMRDNLGLSHGEAEGVSMWPDLMAKGSPDTTARGKIPTMRGIRRTSQVIKNSIVRSPWDMIQRLVPIQGLIRCR